MKAPGKIALVTILNFSLGGAAVAENFTETGKKAISVMEAWPQHSSDNLFNLSKEAQTWQVDLMARKI